MQKIFSAPPKKVHPLPHFTHSPLKIQEVQVPTFLPTLKIFQAPLQKGGEYTVYKYTFSICIFSRHVYSARLRITFTLLSIVQIIEIVLTSALQVRPSLVEILFRPTLKSCSFPIHWPGEIKNSHVPPANRNFFFFAISLSKKMYNKKI